MVSDVGEYENVCYNGIVLSGAKNKTWHFKTFQ
jgi:hypothetical protein